MAYTFQCPAGGNRTSRCVLHSDASLTEFSTNSLIPEACSIYRERIACVDCVYISSIYIISLNMYISLSDLSRLLKTCYLMLSETLIFST